MLDTPQHYNQDGKTPAFQCSILKPNICKGWGKQHCSYLHYFNILSILIHV